MPNDVETQELKERRYWRLASISPFNQTPYTFILKWR